MQFDHYITSADLMHHNSIVFTLSYVFSPNCSQCNTITDRDLLGKKLYKIL